uniref:ATP synthase complex subunit 8 n=1 Tax=Pseudolycoriella sp. XQM-2020 TaxID=2715250 RepID=A0A6G7GBI4_9DIPT|nr:ATP synthase F0 subunit 8 [Pseudolycoriella sp. XQM-2020]
MPQMAPLNWLSLFFMFSLIFVMFNIMNYFSFNNNYKKNESNFYNININNKMLNWKW